MSGQPSAAMVASDAAASAASEPCGRPLTIRSIHRALAHEGRSSPAAVAALARSRSATGTPGDSVTQTTLAPHPRRFTVCKTQEVVLTLNGVPFALYTGQNAPR